MNYIFQHESGWRLTAVNAEGCAGLGQSCPGSKLINACSNWQTDEQCQINFFTQYMLDRYGSWTAAYQHWLVFSSW